jgi:hypothetical protein
MTENRIQKRQSAAVKEKGQYVLAFGVIASMLLMVGFPVFVIVFLGIFAYFLWKIFSSGSRNETREIFEFYLAANDILRDDERRWFGFEVKDVIVRGEQVLQSMPGAPPLVYFTLGALYNKLGDHRSAVRHLAFVVENEKSDERSVVFPSAELQNYVRVLRKIEREPAEAPLTSGAVRALERARKNRAKSLLSASRECLAAEAMEPIPQQIPEAAEAAQSVETGTLASISREQESRSVIPPAAPVLSENSNANGNGNGKAKKDKDSEEPPYSNRKPISEVLHDIYDKNFP